VRPGRSQVGHQFHVLVENMNKQPIGKEIVERGHIERFGVGTEIRDKAAQPAGEFAVATLVVSEAGIRAPAHHRLFACKMNPRIDEQFFKNICHSPVVVSGQRHEVEAVEKVDQPLVIGINGRVPKGHVRFPMEQSHVVIPLQSVTQTSR
jgi:hypothetical protein